MTVRNHPQLGGHPSPQIHVINNRDGLRYDGYHQHLTLGGDHGRLIHWMKL